MYWVFSKTWLIALQECETVGRDRSRKWFAVLDTGRPPTNHPLTDLLALDLGGKRLCLSDELPNSTGLK